MPLKEDLLPGRFKGEIRRAVPMSEYTSFRVGGKVDYLAFPEGPEDLRGILEWSSQQGIPTFILGKGTNLLVRDGGIRGMAISLSRGFLRVEEVERGPEGSLVLAEAGQSLGKLVEFSWKKGLAGLEFAAGIPGSVGGALFMNAGAFRGEIKDVLDSVRLMEAGGLVSEKRKEEWKFDYRSMGLEKGEVILGGKFRLKAKNGQAVKNRTEEIMRQRMSKQPYDLPSAGSVFKNPPQGPAGKLIEEAGLKGYRIGDAQISEKHANFIVNRGRARAQDILALIELARKKVHQEKGVWLETEIQVMGED
jgi:UDP-N-acetylmuramate dehydrogenase